MRPADIERESMRIIDKEFQEKGLRVDPENKAVLYRVIHTSADFDYGKNLIFLNNPVKAAAERMKKGGFTIITDTNMTLSGVSKPSLEKLGGKALCFMADPEIAALAKEAGSTRAAQSMLHGASLYPDGIFSSGNAPTALITLSRLIREGLRPSLVVGTPVGFVNVTESKEELKAVCEEYGVPAIIALGRKGGSNVAAAILNAILYSAAGRLDPASRGW